MVNNFNSIKVRLELTTDIGTLFSDGNFNSIKVRLEHYESKITEMNFSISIP